MPVAVLALVAPLVLAAPEFADDDDAMASFHELDAESPANEGVALVHLGGTYRRIYDIPLYGLELGLCGGHWSERGGDWVCLDGFLGRTWAGLRASGAALRYRADFTAGPLYFGFSPGIVGLSFKRATNGDSMSNGGLALAVLAGGIVARTRASALSVELWANADLYSTPVWGPSLRVAYRF